ncbi:hypothetical protein [Mycobacterium uberis]|nr:hypothetical protein [Mycobacterium uberis]
MTPLVFIAGLLGLLLACPLIYAAGLRTAFLELALSIVLAGFVCVR